MNIMRKITKDIRTLVLLNIPFNINILDNLQHLNPRGDEPIYKIIYQRDFGGDYSGNFKQKLENIYLNIDGLDEYQLLSYASRENYIKFFKFLVTSKKDIMYYILDENSFLGDVAAEGNLEFVKYLISIGVDIHNYNDQAVRWAIEAGQIEVVKYLIENGARIDIYKSLKMASELGHDEMHKYLMGQG